MEANEWKVGVVGLGNMGGKVAESIVSKGFNVIVYDVNPKVTILLKEMGAEVANDLIDIAAKSNIILTSLPNTDIVREVYETILNKVEHGTIFIEMSTIDPGYIKDLDTQVSNKESFLIDLPVSGSPEEAKNGKLVLMAGGNKEVINRLQPLISCFGEQVHYVGKPGDAKAVKVVNNLMTMGNVAVAAEAFSIGLKFGIDPELLFNVLNQSGGRSHHFSKRFPNALQRDFEGRFSVELGEKDVSLGLDLSKSLDVPSPIASLVQQIYRIAKSEGFGQEDIVAVLKLYEKWGRLVN
ncbi:3-hydroxyisobutyrate dehydrogenase [Salirhabdus euzebyi]|uniref:3-hydroxyisobutyrate dehydrogenase n=1 Tax=Salirhabdus euzebyi TaxID=394506 RepID=A0A841Q5Q9_9BACI|nr:NAD(P)-dependent oxidoreductase [Salirhabdus euzebyi]MBB6453714.1 3-hydroxyisobutyrate dehydrogenase [Salirhabdus euzebyi]